MSLQQKFHRAVGNGEASASALVLNFPEALTVIDDLKAGKLAKSLNRKITGSLGVLMKAKKQAWLKN